MHVGICTRCLAAEVGAYIIYIAWLISGLFLAELAHVTGTVWEYGVAMSVLILTMNTAM